MQPQAGERKRGQRRAGGGCGHKRAPVAGREERQWDQERQLRLQRDDAEEQAAGQLPTSAQQQPGARQRHCDQRAKLAVGDRDERWQEAEGQAHIDATREQVARRQEQGCRDQAAGHEQHPGHVGDGGPQAGQGRHQPGHRRGVHEGEPTDLRAGRPGRLHRRPLEVGIVDVTPAVAQADGGSGVEEPEVVPGQPPRDPGGVLVGVVEGQLEEAGQEPDP